MRICLFEDQGVANLEPLTLTRPTFDLLCGLSSLGSKQCRYFAPCEVGVLIRPYLADLFRQQQPTAPVNHLSWLRSGPTVLVNGRWLPPPDTLSELPGPCVGLVGEEVAYAVVSPELLTYCSFNTLDDCLETWKQTLPHHHAGGKIIHYLWDLVQLNHEQICLDFPEGLAKQQVRRWPGTLVVVGPEERILVDPTVHIDPMVVADTRQGPIVVEREAVITAFSRLEGPCYIGPHAQVLGAKIRAGTTLGPHCRMGGEVEASIVQGHSNKVHEGFLGHSYVGEWVNLGAGTNNSDLRNDYGPVTVTVDGEPVATGLTKVGCFLGDHTKTGLATQLNTGTNVGIYCNLLPSGPLLPKTIPSFSSWWNGELGENADLAKVGRTATEVMRRRGCTFTEAHTILLHSLFELTAGERRRAVREGEARRLRRSA